MTFPLDQVQRMVHNVQHWCLLFNAELKLEGFDVKNTQRDSLAAANLSLERDELYSS